MEARVSYNKVEGERLVIKHRIKTLTEQEHCSLHTVVDQYLKRMCELRTIQMRPQLDRAGNWIGKPRYDNAMLIHALANSRGTEHSTDEDIDAVPYDHVHYLHRVSGGVLGSA